LALKSLMNFSDFGAIKAHVLGLCRQGGLKIDRTSNTNFGTALGSSLMCKFPNNIINQGLLVCLISCVTLSMLQILCTVAVALCLTLLVSYRDEITGVNFTEIGVFFYPNVPAKCVWLGDFHQKEYVSTSVATTLECSAQNHSKSSQDIVPLTS
jgi:hypothetical protein